MVKEVNLMKIEKPCTEDFSAMQKNNLGRHCSSCNKTVVDFTKMSTNDIKTHLASASGEVCGRFKSLQLEQKNSFEKFIFDLRERIMYHVTIRPLRLASLTLLSGIMAFAGSCMGAVQRNYEPDQQPKDQKADSLKIKQTSEKKN